MDNYLWESPRSTDEVIGALASRASKKAYQVGDKTSYQIGAFAFTHEQVQKDTISFRLDYLALGMFNFRLDQYWGFYKPPYLVGTITATANGCRILAEKRTARSAIANICYVFLILIAFFIGFYSMFSNGIIINTNTDVLMLLGTFSLGIVLTCSFIFCYIKYHELKQHFELINSVAGIECHPYWGNLL